MKGCERTVKVWESTRIVPGKLRENTTQFPRKFLEIIRKVIEKYLTNSVKVPRKQRRRKRKNMDCTGEV